MQERAKSILFSIQISFANLHAGYRHIVSLPRFQILLGEVGSYIKHGGERQARCRCQVDRKYLKYYEQAENLKTAVVEKEKNGSLL